MPRPSTTSSVQRPERVDDREMRGRIEEGVMLVLPVQLDEP